MRKVILVWGAMMLGGCEPYDSLGSDEDEAVVVASQDESDDPDESVIDSWGALESLKEGDPDLYRINVDLLLEGGVRCTEADAAKEICQTLDQGETEQMLMMAPVRCGTHCAPPWSSVPECWTTCCIDFIYEICGDG